MPQDPHQRAANADTRFKLGRIIGELEGLPSRMDRFEAGVNSDLKEIKDLLKDHANTTSDRITRVEQGTNLRITALEHETWRKSGALGLVGAVLGAGLSGFFTKFWH